MKVIFALCFIALAAAAPRPQEEEIAVEEVIVEEAPLLVEEAPAPIVRTSPVIIPDGEEIAILRDERTDNGDGNFNYVFEASNGITMEVSGTPGAEGAVNMQGSYVLPLADGGFAVVTFIANENGFQPQSEILPTPHPLPAHAIEQIRFAEEQRAAGVTFDEPAAPAAVAITEEVFEEVVV